MKEWPEQMPLQVHGHDWRYLKRVSPPELVEEVERIAVRNYNSTRKGSIWFGGILFPTAALTVIAFALDFSEVGAICFGASAMIVTAWAMWSNKHRTGDRQHTLVASLDENSEWKSFVKLLAVVRDEPPLAKPILSLAAAIMNTRRDAEKMRERVMQKLEDKHPTAVVDQLIQARLEQADEIPDPAIDSLIFRDIKRLEAEKAYAANAEFVLEQVDMLLNRLDKADESLIKMAHDERNRPVQNDRAVEGQLSHLADLRRGLKRLNEVVTKEVQALR